MKFSAATVKKKDDDLMRLIKQHNLIRRRKSFEEALAKDIDDKKNFMNTQEIWNNHFDKMKSIEYDKNRVNDT